MNTNRIWRAASGTGVSRLRTLSLALLLMLVQVSAFAQITAVPQLMNFQGRLTKPDGTPVADGNYSVRFSLHSSVTGGMEKWNQTINPVTVHNGSFAVLLSGFGTGTFHGDLWLEIKIGTDTPLTPRKQLVSVAYAMKADSVKDNAITGASIANGSISAADLAAGTLNPLAWLLGGNSATTPATHFIGTTDNQPLNLRVNNRRAMRYQYAQNTLDPGAEYRSVNVLGGAEINSIGANVTGATIAGGGFDSFAATDFPNQVTSDYGTVSGGIGNTAGGLYATVGGGSSNIANASQATVGGGSNNNANDLYATVPGGYKNTADGYASFAAGYRAKANHDGSFVWADSSTNINFVSAGANHFSVRASGGIRLCTNSGLSAGVTLSPGDSSWNTVSDRNAKTNFQNLDTLDILERLVAIPITAWNYKSNTSIRHIGPMAQDFFAAFNVGMDDKHIGTVDADGVALAAIQGLHAKMRREMDTLKTENDALKARLEALETMVERLTAQRQ